MTIIIDEQKCVDTKLILFPGVSDFLGMNRCKKFFGNFPENLQDANKNSAKVREFTLTLVNFWLL